MSYGFLHTIKCCRLATALLGSILVFSSMAYAGTTNQTASSHAGKQTQSNEPGKQLNAFDKHKYTLQGFDLTGIKQLDVEFVYANHADQHKISRIYFKNNGAPLVIELLENKYVLGNTDELSVKVPHVDTLVLRVSPYTVDASQLMDNERMATQRSYIFARDKNTGMYLLHTQQ